MHTRYRGHESFQVFYLHIGEVMVDDKVLRKRKGGTKNRWIEQSQLWNDLENESLEVDPFTTSLPKSKSFTHPPLNDKNDLRNSGKPM